MNVIHLKLANGDELLCEVIEEPDSEDVNIVIRNSMRIVQVEEAETGYRLYTFRPWMIYQDQPEMLQLLNINHIVGEAKPNKMLAAQYYNALKKEHDRTQREMEDLEKRFEELKEKFGIDIELNEGHGDDSDTSGNIIKFNRKLH